MRKEKLPRWKMLSLFNVCDILLVVTVAFFLQAVLFFFKTKVFNVNYSLGFFVLTFIVFLFQRSMNSKVVNESDSVLWAKPEEDDDPHTIQPGETCKSVDGVKLNDRFFKIPDGLPVVVNNDGLSHFSITGWLYYHVLGREYTNWKKLFDVK